MFVFGKKKNTGVYLGILCQKKVCKDGIKTGLWKCYFFRQGKIWKYLQEKLYPMAGKMACYTDFFPLRIGPLQLQYNVTYLMPK